ncbi:unnamed protein product, partial [Phyllotreta striolata]
MDRNTLSTLTNDVELMENESSFPENHPTPARQAINELKVFLNYLDSTGRIAVSNADQSERQELLGLLTTLTKITKSISQATYRMYHNASETHQDEEHFEEMSQQALNETPETAPLDALEHTENCDNFENNSEDTEEDSDVDDGSQEESLEEPLLGDNSFKFNFRVDYDPPVRKRLYPKGFRSMQIPVNNCLLRISETACVCLLCMKHLIGKREVFVQHVKGPKHAQAALDGVRLMNLNNFHLAFLNLDANFQAHQVYFQPAQHNTDSVHCRMCRTDVKIRNVAEHILDARHKNMFLRNFRNKPTSFFLMDLQLLCYGIENGSGTNEENSAPDSSERIHDVRPSYDLTNPDSWNFLLPFRYLSQSDHFRKNETSTSVKCNLCDKMILSDRKNLLRHIESKAHMTALGKIRQKNYQYFCQICKVAMKKSGWIRHFDAMKDHTKELKEEKLGEYQCMTCNLIIFGEDSAVKNHPKSMNLFKKERKHELSDFTRTTFASAEQLNKVADSMAIEADMVANCTSVTEAFCKRLETIMNAKLGGTSRCKAYPFGSRVCGLGNESSDLDVFLDVGGMYDGERKQDYESQGRIVKLVSKTLRQHRDDFERIYAIPDARTPIVCFNCRRSRLKCDLSFRHGLSVENTEFVGLCLELQPITQKLILVLKKWFQTNQLKKKIPTYAITIMAIFYMQVNGYLFSVNKLRQLNPAPPILIDGWEAITYTMTTEEMINHITPYPDTLEKLLKDFFVYYLNFNYKEDVSIILLHCVKH